MEKRTINYKGRKLTYCVKGEGPAVVLLHGFGEDGTVWKGQYDAFPAHHLIIPDLPGSGESEMIADMSMEGMAAALYYLLTAGQDLTLGRRSLGEGVAGPSPKERGVAYASVPLKFGDSAKNMEASQSGPRSEAPVAFSFGEGRDEVKAERVCLIGHSMGGYIALAFAERYPEALRSFGLFHSTAYADSDEKKQTRRKGLAFIQERGAEAFLKTTIPNLFSSDTREKAPAVVEEAIAVGKGFSKEALVAYYEAMMARPDRTDVLRRAEVPVLFVMGRHDTAVPIDDVLKQCQLPAVADVHILERSGHMGMMEELAETNKILSQFASLEKPSDSR